MRAVQFSEYGPPDVVHVAEVEAPHAGPGEVRITVRASGFSPGETRIRAGLLREALPVELPFRTGFDAAGVVDEVGPGAAAEVGEEVFGWTPPAVRGANAEYAVLVNWARKPAAWSWEEAGGAAGPVETAVRVLDLLGPAERLLVQGAGGGAGAVAVQVAVARGTAVIGTASERNHDFLRSLGAIPSTYGPGLAERVRAIGPVDAVLDAAGGALPELVAIAGHPDRVVTIADLTAADHGVRLSRGPLADHALAVAVQLAAEGRLTIPVGTVLLYEQAAEAHRLSESRHACGRIVLLP